MLGNTSKYSWILLVIKCLQAFTYFANPSNYNSQLEFIQASIRLDICFINIHALSDWFTILCVLNHESLVIDEILYLLKISFQPMFSNIYDNFVTSAKFLGSGMKSDTLEPDSPKLVNSCKISNTIVLNTLCKPFPILCVTLNAPFRCYLFFLMQLI